MARIIIFIKIFHPFKNNFCWIFRASNLTLILILITAIWILIFNYFIFRSTFFWISITLIFRLFWHFLILFFNYLFRNNTLTWWAINTNWLLFNSKIIHLTFLITILTLNFRTGWLGTANIWTWRNLLWFSDFFFFLYWLSFTFLSIFLFILNVWWILTFVRIGNCSTLWFDRSQFGNIWW